MLFDVKYLLIIIKLFTVNQKNVKQYELLKNRVIDDCLIVCFYRDSKTGLADNTTAVQDTLGAIAESEWTVRFLILVVVVVVTRGARDSRATTAHHLTLIIEVLLLALVLASGDF